MQKSSVAFSPASVELFEILMRRHNQQLYRAARAVVNDEAEVEDIMQQAYFNAFTHLHQFEERARFSTWMTRIVLNEAFARRRKRQQVDAFAKRHPGDDDGEMMEPTTSQPDPERQAYGQELRRVLEDAVDALPESLSHGLHASRRRGTEHERDRRRPGTR